MWGVWQGKKTSGDFQGNFRDTRYGSLYERSLNYGDFNPKGSVLQRWSSAIPEDSGMGLLTHGADLGTEVHLESLEVFPGLSLVCLGSRRKLCFLGRISVPKYSSLMEHVIQERNNLEVTSFFSHCSGQRTCFLPLLCFPVDLRFFI